jgi:hypothetical protein
MRRFNDRSSRTIALKLMLLVALLPFASAGAQSPPAGNGTATAQTEKSNEGDGCKNPELRDELLNLGEEDQQHRLVLHELFTKYPDGIPQSETEKVLELQKAQDAIDQRNIARLEEIVAQYGWPGKSLVGDKAAQAAFLIVQHAELAYQEKYLPILKDAVSKKEARPSEVAMLEDRVLMRQGKSQIYGTQLVSDASSGGKLQLHPIEDEANVDRRRADVGLPPLREYLKLFGLEYQPAAK